MTGNTYSMSFTTATLLYRESIVAAELYAELGDWDAVREIVVGENRFQMRTLNTSKRICREAISRLKLLTPAQLELVRTGTRQEQNYVLWLAVCKRYRFIHDFAVEIVREKYLRLDWELSYAEYDAFFYRKAEWHPEMEKVTETTRKKQRQFVFRMLREAEILSKTNQIQPALLTPHLIDAIVQDDAAHLAIFPVSESDVQEWNK